MTCIHPRAESVGYALRNIWAPLAMSFPRRRESIPAMGEGWGEGGISPPSNSLPLGEGEWLIPAPRFHRDKLRGDERSKAEIIT